MITLPLSIDEACLWEKAVRKMTERSVYGEKIEKSQNPAFTGQGEG